MATVRNIGNICVIQNEPGDHLVRPDKTVNYKEAYRLFRTINPDTFDFVTFFHDYNSSDPASFPKREGSDSFRVWREIKGLGPYPGYKDHVIDERKDFNTTFLKSVQIIDSAKFPGTNYEARRTLLHEVGHHWLCYTPYKDPHTGATMTDNLLKEPAGHWSNDLNADESPMNYIMRKWATTNEPNVYESVELLGKSKFYYCDLDLYLMGLLEPENVAPLFLLRNKQKIETGTATQLYKADKVVLTVNDFIAANGKLEPSIRYSQKYWRQAFVVLTNSIANVNTFVMSVEQFRQEWEKDFSEATRNAGRVETRLDEDIWPPVNVNNLQAKRLGVYNSGTGWLSAGKWPKNTILFPFVQTVKGDFTLLGTRSIPLGDSYEFEVYVRKDSKQPDDSFCLYAIKLALDTTQ